MRILLLTLALVVLTPVPFAWVSVEGGIANITELLDGNLLCGGGCYLSSSSNAPSISIWTGSRK
jgi:hypothetical protein